MTSSNIFTEHVIVAHDMFEYFDDIIEIEILEDIIE